MATAGERRTVLVVDDEPAIRLICRVNLELDGHRVLEASGNDEARALLAAEAVDVVFLDLHLSGERGDGLLDELRGRVPVALVTGSTEATAADRPDADAILAKPFEPAELSETVRRLTP
ncbi:MAG TPA: response regulator [Gaiellaceae bacterium]|nr:response regulator [Gaiellaceae bacterium]